MKKQNEQNIIYVCPKLEIVVSQHSTMYSNGICRECGHKNNNTVYSHAVKRIGHWEKPNIIERLMGKRKRFIQIELYESK